MIVDREGRAYAGNFGFDLMGGGEPAMATLVRVDPDGTATVAAEDLWFPNRMVITVDGTLIVTETFAARFTAFRIAADGTLTDRDVWAQVEPSPDPADTETMLGAVTFAPARWTPTGTSGPRTPWAAQSAGSAPAARSSTRSRSPTGWACSPAALAAETAAPSSPAPPRTSTRRHARPRARRCC